MRQIIAIDGPAASGKGTLARRIAKELHFAHLDTGALYRLVGLGVLRNGGDPSDAREAARVAQSLDANRVPDLILDPALRQDGVGQAASKVAVVPAVRAALLDFQRHFAQDPPGNALGAVLDGRDIGTEICPDAPVKLFVTATVDIRAGRRLRELQARGLSAIYEDVLKDMQARDARDSGRAVAPLVPAVDAFLLDTSALDADQTFAAALSFVRSRLAVDAL